jgi:hypothetical protein
VNTKQSPVAYASLYVVVVLLIEFAFVRLLGTALIPLFIGGFVLWRLTTYRTPVDPRTIIVPYLLTVIAFIAHVYEEYQGFIRGYPDVLKGVLTLDLEELLTFAAFLAPIMWLGGAVMLLKRWSVGYFAASTFLFGMMFIEPTHFLAPFIQDGTFHYVGGMWTAILPISMGWYTFTRLRREVRASKETVAPGGGAHA